MLKSVTLSLAFAASVCASQSSPRNSRGRPRSLAMIMFVSDNPNDYRDVAELTPGAADWFKDAAKNAWNSWDNRAPGQCPKPTITVNVPKGDPISFQAAVAAARRDAAEGCSRHECRQVHAGSTIQRAKATKSKLTLG